MDPLYHAPLIPPTKICNQCHAEKPLEEFYKDTRKKTGYRSVCKDCLRYRKQHPRIIQKPLFVISKVCKGCQIEKPLEAFDIHKACKSDGRRAKCKECRHTEHKQTYNPRKTPLPLAINGGKVCRVCKTEKPLNQFGKDKRASDGLGTQCKACVHYREQILNHDRTLARTRAHWEKSGKKYRVQHEKWRKANQLKCNQLSRKRVARQRAATIGKVNYKNVLERDGYWCHICEKAIDPTIKGPRPDALSFDHVIPLARGGSHTEDNLKPAHKTCNSRKGIKLLSEMTAHQRRGL